MNRRLYRKLAWTGIKKNKQLYVPYLLSGVVMVMVFYILSFLAASDMVHNLRGGEAMTSLLLCGEWLMGLFSLPFLFYTSTSLMKKRKKEFGLYNILGMNKGNILTCIFWESLMAYGIVAGAGIFFGILFSKAAELGLVNIMEEEANYQIYIEGKSVLTAVVLFAVIYFLIFLNTARQIRYNNPMELLQSGSVGEKPPQGKWVLAAAGIVLTAFAYAWAVRINNPREAMSQVFLIAAIIVVGTYLLFIAGSVFLCKKLQENKHYYYKTAHFVTISSLSYRMKRNGASLASICILATIILAILVTTVGFYTGVDSIIESHYPYDIGITIEAPNGQKSGYGSQYDLEIENKLEEMNVNVSETIGVYEAGLSAYFENGVLDLSVDIYKDAPEEGNVEEWNKYLENFVSVRVLSLEDYNKLCHVTEELGEREVLIAGGVKTNEAKYIRNWDGSEYTVKKVLKQAPKLSGFKLYSGFVDMMLESPTLVVPDMESFWGNFDPSEWLDKNEVLFFWEYDVNLQEERDRQFAIGDAVSQWAQKLSDTKEDQNFTYYSKVERWASLKSLAGGVLFLALVISMIFVFVATLILYYKQISEGYEDQKQFSIMRKIGMTKKEIRRSIHSQMLTVFSLPLMLAGIHLIFAVPGIYQVLKYSILDDKPLLIRVAIISFLLFSVAYSIVYLLTTRTYYRIVNRGANER